MARNRQGLGALALALLTLSACAEADAGPLLIGSTIVERGASNPTVAVARGSGQIYLSWVATEAGQSNVVVTRAEADGSFAAPVRANDLPGDAAPHGQAPAQIALGPGEEVYVVWQNQTDVEWLDFGASDVRFARSEDGGQSWSPAITVNDNPADEPARNTFHDIAVGADGSIIVSWIDARVRDAYRGELFKGHISAAEGDEEPGTEIRLSRSTDGGRTFTPSVVLESNSCPCCRTASAVAPDGTIYVSYRKIFEGGIRDIAVVHSNDGGQSFSEPVRVHADGWVFPGCPHAGADLAVDNEGRLHVAWYTGTPSDPGAYYAISADGGRSFGAPTRLTPPGPIPTTQVALASDAEGNVWVAWEDPEGELPSIRLARSENGALRSVRTGAPTGMLPSLWAEDGRLAIAWLDGEAVKILRTDE